MKFFFHKKSPLNSGGIKDKDMEIIDPKGWLTKRQRQKIRQSVEGQGFQKEKILQVIQYRENEGPYRDCEMRENTLCFSETDPRREAREKLLTKLRLARGSRRHHALDSWKKYYQLSNHPSLQGVAIPNPKDVVKNKDAFEAIRNMDRTGWMKGYIDLCLEEQDQLG